MCSNCILWNGYYPENYNDAAVDQILNTIGTKGTDQRKLGVGSLWTYHLTDLNRMKQSMQKMLDLSLARNFPIFISLDGFQWWDNLKNLWNWWDPSDPATYNPENKNNVEWTSWNPNDAIKISWRSWGKQLRVKPHPNIASPAFIQANKDALKNLVPIIVNWYNNLPDNKKYLLGGVSFSQEVDIGVNYTYYKDGNSYLGKPESSDPDETNFLKDSVQLGYAAVKTAGLKSSGALTEDDLDTVVRNYIEELNSYAVSLGIPRHKIFNQVGGKGFAPFEHPSNLVFSTAKASITPHGNPGWSFYAGVAENAATYPALTEALNLSGNSLWGSPEYLPYKRDRQGWIDSLRNSLNFRNNKFINITSWEGILGGKDVYAPAVGAIRQVLNETPVCVLGTPQINRPIAVSGSQFTLNWTQSADTLATYINCANSPKLTNQGTFNPANIVVNQMTTETSFQKSGFNNGTYYCQVITDGCDPAKRTLSEIVSFTIGSSPSPTPKPIIPGDTNSDGKVNISDFGVWKTQYLTKTGLTADFNSNGKIDIGDFGIWKAEYLKTKI